MSPQTTNWIRHQMSWSLPLASCSPHPGSCSLHMASRSIHSPIRPPRPSELVSPPYRAYPHNQRHVTPHLMSWSPHLTRPISPTPDINTPAREPVSPPSQLQQPRDTGVDDQAAPGKMNNFLTHVKAVRGGALRQGKNGRQLHRFPFLLSSGMLAPCFQPGDLLTW